MFCRRWFPAALFLLAVGGWVAIAQSPVAGPSVRTTIPFEEDDPNAPSPPYERIDLDDDLPDVAAALGAYYARLDGVARAAASVKNPKVREFLAGFTVAYDRVTERAAPGRPMPRYRITPVPLLWESLGGVRFPDEFGVLPLTENNRLEEEVKPLTRPAVNRIDPFEKIALAAVDRFLTVEPPATNPPTRAEVLAASERVVSEVLLFHEQARDTGRRKGKVWDAVKDEVNAKLTELRIARVRQAVADKDWGALRAMHGPLIARYRNDPKVLEVVYAAQLAEAEDRLKSDRVADLEQVRSLVDDYYARFPHSTDETARRLRKAIAEKAAQLLAEATRVALQNPNEARNILRTVESLDPDADGLRQRQQELTLKSEYAVLAIATRRLPERMSPATARWDSERQAVELLFEPLIDALPDETTGVRYWPALAADRPTVGALVREFALVGSAEWAGPGRGPLDLADLAGTVGLLRRRPGLWEADPIAWIRDVTPAPGEYGRVRVRFERGHPDPRGLLGFKLLPARWLSTQGKEADDREFARRPFGTGPFRLAPSYRPPTPGEPPLGKVAFLSNPSFGRRPGRFGQPSLREIHFVDLNRLANPIREFEAGNLHLLPDVPTAELARYEASDAVTKGKVVIVNEANPRRVHLLAINHRRPTLQSVNLRRGLLHAIDREVILNETFRAGRDDLHRAMNGPFPPNCWASAKSKVSVPAVLFDRDLAAAKFRAHREAGGHPVVRLAFAADDPIARRACERIKADVEEAGGGAEGNGVSVDLDPLSPEELYRQVQEEHRYDLAYLPFDYRDDWYPLELASFLDPTAAGPGGRNYLGYLAAGTNPGREGDEIARLLADARIHCDFAGKLLPVAHDIHRKFNDAVPFVPLWHLDRHMIVSTALKVYLDGRTDEVSPRMLDQTKLFTSVAGWRLE